MINFKDFLLEAKSLLTPMQRAQKKTLKLTNKIEKHQDIAQTSKDPFKKDEHRDEAERLNKERDMHRNQAILDNRRRQEQQRQKQVTQQQRLLSKLRRK